MVYAMTWNESGTQMVQVGIKPVRLMEELEATSVQSTLDDISLDHNMTIVVADASTFEVLAAKNRSYIGKGLNTIANVTTSEKNNCFHKGVKLEDQSGYYYCSTGFTEEYFICVFMDYDYFATRTIETILLVLFYLLIAFLVIMIVIRRLLSTRQENYRHLQVFESMSEIYYSLHLVDLKKNSVMEYSSKNHVKKVLVESQSGKADEIMVGIMKATMSDEYLERGLEFSDMTTVAERMKDKKIISMELLGKNVGWIRMSFITFEAVDGIPTKIIIATQIIDEEKKMAESLYEKSYVDELTRCFNRRAYNSDIITYRENPEDKDLVYISFDVNGLKTVNDDLGHEAGDELLIGASQCMNHAFSKHGKIYRNGGDEFIGLIHADSDLMKMLCQDFNDQLKSWKGKMINSISVSYGYVFCDQEEGRTIDEIADLADKRMYQAKADYYKEKGIERRRT
ncbi:MAG: GGDEF domain-containing protein [Eubacterium sp.]|nr:GGDEF domain-containing protein [Eubacterium sp.]